MRLKSIDSLRGIAVILVLFRHHWVGIDAMQHVGWVGVDLFFVLSGFLVSGLLFNEHERYGEIRPGRFLIRRGFKIYPLFYLSLTVTFVLIAAYGWTDQLNWKGHIVAVFSELFFLQSYLPGIWEHHWSLAVEEHFYISLALLFPLIRTRILKIAPFLFVGCLVLRIVHPHFSWTHLRIDSLFMGVCLAYAHHHGTLEGFYQRNKRWIIALCFIPIAFAFTEPLPTNWTENIGFSLLYISFASLLMVFLYEDIQIPLIAKVGYYSYGIYVVHLYLMRYVLHNDYLFPGPYVFEWNVIPSFLLFFFGAIFIGIATSYLIEKPILALRDKWFPKAYRSRPQSFQP